MATHAVCPLCSKSSSVRSFPSGEGKDIILQSFKGLGRGKGFAVVERESGLGDRYLCIAVKERLLSLMAAFVDHGYVTPRELTEVATRVKPPGGPPLPGNEVATLKARVASLEAKLQRERTARGYLEVEVADLERQAAQKEEASKDHEDKVTDMQERLEGLQGAPERFAAIRDHVRSLHRSMGQLELAAYEDKDEPLSELLQVMEEDLKAIGKEAREPLSGGDLEDESIE